MITYLLVFFSEFKLTVFRIHITFDAYSDPSKNSHADLDPGRAKYSNPDPKHLAEQVNECSGRERSINASR